MNTRLTTIQQYFFCSRYIDVQRTWVAAKPSMEKAQDKYCVALTAYFGGVEGMNHTNEFATTLLIDAAEHGYLPASGALRSLFDWYIEKNAPEKLHLIDAGVVDRLIQVNPLIDPDSAYWVGRLYLQGDQVRKNKLFGLTLLKQIAIASRPSYCYEFGETLEAERTRKAKTLAIHYFYYAAKLGDQRAVRHIGRSLATGSDNFPYEPTLSDHWLGDR